MVRAMAAMAMIDHKRNATITIDGPLNDATERSTRHQIECALAANARLLRIQINSPGGDNDVCRNIVRDIELARLATMTFAGRICHSAAVDIFVLGDWRRASKRSAFLLHRSALLNGSAGVARMSTTRLRQIVEEMERTDEALTVAMSVRGIRLSNGDVARYQRGEDVTFSAWAAHRVGLVNEIVN